MSRKSTTSRINTGICGFPCYSPGVVQDPVLGSRATEETISVWLTELRKVDCLCAAGTLHLKCVLSGGLTCKFRQGSKSHLSSPSLTAARGSQSQLLLDFGSDQWGEHRRLLLVSICSWVWGACWKGAAWEVCVNRNAQLAQSLLSAYALRDLWRKWCLGADWHAKPMGHTWQSLCVLLAAWLGY